MERATGKDWDGDGLIGSNAKPSRQPATSPAPVLGRGNSVIGSGPGSKHFKQFSALAHSSSAAASTWSQGQMPEEQSCFKTGELEKQTLNLQWKARFVAITTERILFSRSDENHVVDMISLEDVKGIEAMAVADEESESHQLTTCKSILQHANSFREHLHLKADRHDDASIVTPDASHEAQITRHASDTDAADVDKHKWLQTHISKQESKMCFEIHTHDGGFNNGRSYLLKASSVQARDEWIEAIHKAIQAGKAEREHERYRTLPLRIQRDLRRAYHSRPAQVCHEPSALSFPIHQ